MENSTILNGTIVLDTRTEDDLSESCLVLRKLITDNYSVDVHPYIDEDGMTEFVKVDIYDEKLSSVDYSDDYHAAAEDGNYDMPDKPLTMDELIATLNLAIKRIEKGLEKIKQNSK